MFRFNVMQSCIGGIRKAIAVSPSLIQYSIIWAYFFFSCSEQAQVVLGQSPGRLIRQPGLWLAEHSLSLFWARNKKRALITIRCVCMSVWAIKLWIKYLQFHKLRKDITVNVIFIHVIGFIESDISVSGRYNFDAHYNIIRISAVLQIDYTWTVVMGWYKSRYYTTKISCHLFDLARRVLLGSSTVYSLFW